MGFIKLEEPKLKNLPSKEESERFEMFMRACVEEANASGYFFDGRVFLESADENDLAYVFETALADWCDSHRQISRSVTYENSYKQNEDGTVEILKSDCVDVETVGEVCFELQMQAIGHFNDVFEKHMTKTGGSIGHFPYSGERVLLNFKDDFGTHHYVKFDPSDIFPDANEVGLEKAAEINNPEKKAADKAKRLKKVGRTKNIQFIVFILSIVSFLIGLMLSPAVSGTDNDLSFFNLFMMTQFITLPFPVGFISLRLYRKNKKLFKSIQAKNPYKFDDVKLDPFSLSLYTKRQFKKDANELYKFFRFRQIWEESIGGTNVWSGRIKHLLKTLEPFLSDEND